MCHANEDVACGILIADEQPSGDQRIDERRSRRRARDFAERSAARTVTALPSPGPHLPVVSARSTAGNT